MTDSCWLNVFMDELLAEAAFSSREDLALFNNMALVELSVTYVLDFHVEPNPINYNVKFGVALLRCAAPQILKCVWEEVVVFPCLASTLNPMYSGIRLIDVVSMLSSEDIV